MFDKFFSIHLDIVTHEQHLVRISLSNLYREFKVTQTAIQFPFTTSNEETHWTILCLDLESILLTYMSNQHYHMIKSIQLCGNLMVKNCFSSQYLYEPGAINHHTAKQSGLKCTSLRSLPRELSFPVNKGESWHEKYDFIQIPHPTTEKESHPRSPTPVEENPPSQSLTSRSLTDISRIHSPLPDSQLSSRQHDDGVHLFVHPPSIPATQSIHDDSNYDLALNTDRSHLPNNPILRLRTIIGLGTSNRGCRDLLWTQDGTYVLYPSNAIVVQMQIETQQQWFFIGHTDKVSAIAFNGNSSLLATTQAGPNGNIDCKENIFYSNFFEII